MLFLDKISTNSYDKAFSIYVSMKNAVNLLKRNKKDTYVSFVGDRILWIPTRNGVLDLGSEWISCHIAKADL